MKRPLSATNLTSKLNDPPSRAFRRAASLVSLLFLLGIAPAAPAQNFPARSPGLPADRYKSGETTLEAFVPVVAATRHSVVKLDRNGITVALGTIIDREGLAITKASEINGTEGRLTAWLSDGKEVEARIVAEDEASDVALVRISATGLKPIQWASRDVTVGQWAVTAGIEAMPQAVGVISVPPRRILHKRAMIGVQLDFRGNADQARIAQLLPGMGAEKAGLKAGDTIIAVNDSPVESRENLINALRHFREGQTVQLRIQREESEFEAAVEMMPEPVDPAETRVDRQTRMNRMGSDLSARAEGFELAIQHDTVLQPWQCGGPLVDLEGKAIGINIARAGRTASYALHASVAREIVENLKQRANLAPPR